MLRTALAALFLLLAFVLQFRAGHMVPDFVLGALLVFAVTLSFGELLAALIIALWGLAWQPVPSIELVWFAGVPLLVALVVRRLPLAPWAAFALFLPAGVLLFYLFIDPWFITRNPELFIRLFVGTAVFAACIFELLRPMERDARRTV